MELSASLHLLYEFTDEECQLQTSRASWKRCKWLLSGANAPRPDNPWATHTVVHVHVVGHPMGE